MEKFFKLSAQLSASFVFVILVATVVVLYITAKPAIEEFGAHFIIDPRWCVDVIQENAPSTDPQAISTSSDNQIKPSSSTDTTATVSTASAKNTGGADDTLDNVDDMSIDDEFDTDETIPQMMIPIPAKLVCPTQQVKT